MKEYMPAWLNAYINVPFADYNCYNLIRKVYTEQFDITLKNVDEEYLHSFDIRRIAKLYLREMRENWMQIPEPEFGCMVAFRVKGSLWHCGMVVNYQYMLHTQSVKMASCLELYDGLEYKPKRKGYYRYVSKS